MRDGTRKVINITEVSGMEGDVITMTDIFVFEQTGIENGRLLDTYVQLDCVRNSWIRSKPPASICPHPFSVLESAAAIKFDPIFG